MYRCTAFCTTRQLIDTFQTRSDSSALRWRAMTKVREDLSQCGLDGAPTGEIAQLSLKAGHQPLQLLPPVYPHTQQRSLANVQQCSRRGRDASSPALPRKTGQTPLCDASGFQHPTCTRGSSLIGVGEIFPWQGTCTLQEAPSNACAHMNARSEPRPAAEARRRSWKTSASG